MGAGRFVVATLLALTAGFSPAKAQSYPAQTIKMIAPFAPGGPVDALARVIAHHFQGRLKQNIVIEDRSGDVMRSADVAPILSRLGYEVKIDLCGCLRLLCGGAAPLPVDPARCRPDGTAGAAQVSTIPWDTWRAPEAGRPCGSAR
jgi:hypothetical protein